MKVYILIVHGTIIRVFDNEEAGHIMGRELKDAQGEQIEYDVVSHKVFSKFNAMWLVDNG